MEGYWDVVVSSLQDACNSNELISFDNLEFQDTKNKDQLIKRKEIVLKHKENLEKTKRILDTALINVNGLISQLKKNDGNNNNNNNNNENIQDNNENDEIKNSSNDTSSSIISKKLNNNNNNSIIGINGISKQNKQQSLKTGKSYYTSNYNPNGPIIINSEVAFKPKQKNSEWIQCKVLKIFNEFKFEIKDPEPDENNPNGQNFKCNWKEIILIPSIDQILNNSIVKNYPVGTKVLARYPETTTFYPAEVIGFTKNGNCRLKFEGEEEVGKETEVERRLVLPFPH